MKRLFEIQKIKEKDKESQEHDHKVIEVQIKLNDEETWNKKNKNIRPNLPKQTIEEI